MTEDELDLLKFIGRFGGDGVTEDDLYDDGDNENVLSLRDNGFIIVANRYPCRRAIITSKGKAAIEEAGP